MAIASNQQLPPRGPKGARRHPPDTIVCVSDQTSKSAAKGPFELPPIKQSEKPAPPSGSIPARRAIVVEDEALIRMDVVETLQEAGFDVVGEAGDGETAVALTLELKPDVVVMDVKMPKMDGITAAELIAAERIAPVVMLTAFSQRELVERANEAGAMAYVVKPFDASDVVPAIEIAMARYAQIRAVEDEVLDLSDRLASRKIIDQAKGLLQESTGMTEPEAFRWIQKTAMNLRKSMREVAEGVIAHAKQADDD